MRSTTIKRLCGAGATLACLAAVPALTTAAEVGPSGARATVRIEGSTHTLLPATTVLTTPGSLTAFGAPKGACSDQSAAGALQLSTHGHWAGSFSTKYGDYTVTSILGESHSFTGPAYWALWVNNVYASAGICGTKIHGGEHILFGVYPIKGTVHPSGILAPTRARLGQTLKVKVLFYTDAGKAKPLSGATLTAGGLSLKANRLGVVTVKASHVGALLLGSATRGYVRAATVTVRVTK